MSQHDCHSCQGIQPLTPLPTNNPAGLGRLQYRIGRHASFVETMLARLSSNLNAPLAPRDAAQRRSILTALTARDPDDMAIALLDGWSTIAHVLTFYQERLINEAYLGTAVQRASVEYLAKQVGFEPRQGLSASVLLAFQVDDRSPTVLIPAGTPAKSTPVPGSTDQPQTFETSEDFEAHAEWNRIHARRTRPHQLLQVADVLDFPRLYLKGGGLRIQKNDLIAIQLKGEVHLEFVESAKETTTDEQGLLTVVNLVDRQISVDELINDVEKRVNTFFGRLAASQLLNENHLKQAADFASIVIDRTRKKRLTLRLEGVDNSFQEDLVWQFLLNDDVLTNPNNTGETYASLPRLLNLAEDWLGDECEAGKPLGMFKGRNITGYSAARKAYIDAHATALTLLGKLKDFPESLNVGVNKDYATFVDKLRKFIWDSEFRRADDEKNNYVDFLLALNNVQRVDDSDPMNPSSALRLNLEPALTEVVDDLPPAVGQVFLEWSEAHGDDRIVEPIIGVLTKEKVETAIGKLALNADFSGHRFLLIGIETPVGGKHHTLAAAVQHVTRKLPVPPVVSPPRLKVVFMKTTFVLRGEDEEDIIVDDNFELQELDPPSSAETYSVEVEHLKTHELLFTDNGTAAQLAATLQLVKVPFGKDDPPKTILFRFKKNSKPIAFAIRVVARSKVQSTLRNELVATEAALRTEGPTVGSFFAFRDKHTDVLIEGKLKEVTGEDKDLSNLRQISNDDNLPPATRKVYFLEDADDNMASTIDDIWKNARTELENLAPPAWLHIDDEISKIKDEHLPIVIPADSHPATELDVAMDRVHGRKNTKAGKVTGLWGLKHRFFGEHRIEIVAADGGGIKVTSKGHGLPLNSEHAIIVAGVTGNPVANGEHNAKVHDPDTFIISDVPNTGDFQTSGTWRSAESIDSDRDLLAKQVLFELLLRRRDFVERIVRTCEVRKAAIDSSGMTDAQKAIIRNVVVEADDPSQNPSNSLVVRNSRLAGLILKVEGGADPSDDAEAVFVGSPVLLSPVELSGDPQGFKLTAFSERLGKLDENKAWKGVIGDINTQLVRFQVAQEVASEWIRELSGIVELEIAATGASIDVDKFISNFGDQVTVSGLTARELLKLLGQTSDLRTQVKASLNPEEREMLYSQLRRLRNTKVFQPRVWIFRSKAALFGWNANSESGSVTVKGDGDYEKRVKAILGRSDNSSTLTVVKSNILEPHLHLRKTGEVLEPDHESELRLFLDGDFKPTVEGSPIALQVNPDDERPQVHEVVEVTNFPRTRYGLSAKTTRLETQHPHGLWPTNDESNAKELFPKLRQVAVWCDAEELPLGEVPLRDYPRSVSLGAASELELDGFYPQLSTQARLLLQGIQRLPGDDSVGGVVQTELLQAIKIVHTVKHPELYGDRIVTTLSLAKLLTRDYWRDKAAISANVVEATHGETVRETLGSGNSQRAFQRFKLQKAPLTLLPAPTLTGAEPALNVRVNNVSCDNVATLLDARKNEEVFEIRTSPERQSSIRFGDGIQGTRVPTGTENVRAVYRTGLGIAGNVEPNRIDQLPSPPLGVTSVANYVAGFGGFDPDGLPQTRLRTGLIASTSGRLVSIADYRSFVLSFAGIEKAYLRAESGRLIITVTSQTSAPLAADGLLLRNLRTALRTMGDRQVVADICPHRTALMLLSATVHIDSRFDAESLQQQLRIALFDRFSFQRQEIAQDVLRSDVLATMHQVTGVKYVDIQAFDAIENDQLQGLETRVRARIVVPDRGRLRKDAYAVNKGESLPPDISLESAFVCHLDPSAPDTLLLEVVR